MKKVNEYKQNKSKSKQTSKKLLTAICVASLIGSSTLNTCAASVTAAATTGTVSLLARQMERLDRGLVAMYQGGGKVFLSWRLLVSDPENITFNVYRSSNNGSYVKLNSQPISTSTNFIDTSANITLSNSYYIKAVVNGVEMNPSDAFTIPANSAAKQYIPIKLKAIDTGDYSVQHVYTGDLNGDGKYDYVVKRMDSTRMPIILDAYLSDGTFLWRMNLGPNVETGNSTMTSPVLVADFNSDGKAEVFAKTGEGTTFGDGTTIGDTNGDKITDYRISDPNAYAQVLSGPEFVSMVDGVTGKETGRTDFIPRGNVSDWGDNYGNRMNFIFATVAYLDGVHPSIVMSRGPGGRMHVQALNFSNNTFTKPWSWNSENEVLKAGYETADFHCIRALDLDSDGKDEISWGGFALNENGKLLYATDVVHGDRFQIADIDPDRPGLETYVIQQNNPSLLAAELYDAATGVSIKKYYMNAVGDVGRGDVGDIDPTKKGLEMWCTQPNVYDCKGNVLFSGAAPHPGIGIWWDGDLLRENLDTADGPGYSPVINKWNYKTGTNGRLFSIYQQDVVTPYAGRAPLYADILGDWREEIVLESRDHSELRIFTSTIETDKRIYTLMQNPAYRNSVNVKAYMQTNYTDYYLGDGMVTPTTPSVYLVGTPTPTTIPDGQYIKSLAVNDTANAADWSIQSNLQVGDNVYGDRTNKFNGIPNEFLGSEWIRTACDSKVSTWDLASFTTKSNVSVYVGMDARITNIPTWLSDWTNTGESLTNDSSVTFKLYKKDFPANSNIVLGTNGGSTSVVNYTVIVMPSAPSFIYGDVNGDSVINSLDYAIMRSYILQTISTMPSKYWDKAGDLNADGQINSLDYAYLKKYLLGLIDKFPAS